MNIVYKMSFLQRIKAKTPPYFYIGMKTMCRIENGMIIDRNEKPYWSSTRSSKMIDALEVEKPRVDVLFSSEDSEEVCNREREILFEVDAAHNEMFFNLTNGTIDPTFHSNEYATYRHRDFPNVYKRLRRDDSMVLSGVYVGTTNGLHIKKHKGHARFGEENSFYGKHHSEKTRKVLSDIAKKRSIDYTKMEKMWAARRGRTTSELQKQSVRERSRGKKMLKDPVSGKSEQVLKGSERAIYLESQGWLNPSKLKMLKMKEALNETNS